jgi:DNA primase
LTEDQLALLWRVSNEPVLSFDGDSAGLRAAYRAADLALPLLEPGRSVRFALLPGGKDPDDLVKESGRAAFDAVLADARPLADLIWSRETASGVFDTPERRADLEKTLRELTGRIRDESVRRHYGQDMRDRIALFFDRAGRAPASRGRDGARDMSLGPGGRGRGLPGRLPVSESLARSRLVTAASAAAPLREMALVMIGVHHPAIVDRHFEDFSALDLGHPHLVEVHGAVLDAIAHDGVHDGSAMRAAMEKRGLSGLANTFEAALRRARLWVATQEAHEEDAREAFLQALALHRRSRTLHKDLKAAEAALASDPTDDNYRHLLDIQRQIRDATATEALIEGFGVASGRGGRGK